MSHTLSLTSAFDQFNKLKVLIIGDVMLDSYIWGKVERISPEAPVPVVQRTRTEDRLGGASNVAVNIKALGAEPILCSIIGTDSEGDRFLTSMQEQGLDTQGIIRSVDRKTTHKLRVLSGHQHMLRVDHESTQDLNVSEQTKIQKIIDQLIGQCQVIIFEDYDKGMIDAQLIEFVKERAAALHIPIAVDPKKKHFLDYTQVSLFKPNLKELKEGIHWSGPMDTIEEIVDAIEKLDQKLHAASYLITLSEKGVLIYSQGKYYHLPAHIRSISDVSGAGDTVIATASLALSLKMPLGTVAALANLAGGLVCEQIGVVPIQKDQLLAEALKLEISELV